MKCHALRIVLVVVGAVATAGPCFAKDLWVDGSAAVEDADGSANAPFRTITAAMAAAKPGGIVTVRAGVYREQFRLPQGEPGSPITLRAAEGDRVVVTGCEKLDGWKTSSDGRWTTAVDFKPGRLFVRGQQQTVARVPNEGWWRSSRADGAALIDNDNLAGIDAAPTGGQVRVWLQQGNTFKTLPLKQLDATTGRVLIGPTKDAVRLTGGDKYFLQNRAEWIDQPGEWAVEPDGEQFRVSFMPRDPADLQHVEAPRLDRALIYVRGGHVRIEGIEVTGSRQFGIQVHEARDVTIRRCVAHHNGYLGISIRATEDGVVAQNIVWRNEYGISVSYSKRVTIEENDVAHNGVDGILVTWQSDDIMVRRNFVHDHLLWGHPDNLQVYRGVTNVRFQDNLLLTAGQSVMMEETSDGQFTGNMVVGCGAYMLIMGHGNASRYKIHGNTLAFCGYGCMNLTGEDYDVRENVMITGHGSVLFGTKGIRGYRADRNVFFNSQRATDPSVMATDAGWHRDFESARRSTGQDAQSVYADPKFRNAPIAFCVLDSGRLHECTKDTWYVRRAGGLFRPGDHVEVNFDGVIRRVVRITDETITVEPPLPQRPIKGWLVANWGETSDYRLDLRLAADSPGTKLSTTGGPVGSTIDIQAFQRGDFNGDGRRDVPELPPELRR